MVAPAKRMVVLIGVAIRLRQKTTSIALQLKSLPKLPHGQLGVSLIHHKGNPQSQQLVSIQLTSQLLCSRVVARRPSTASPVASTSRCSKLQFEGFTHDGRLAMALLVDTHYLLGQGIRELIRSNPTNERIKEMGSWLEHLELNGMVPYEA
ncbi:hypothetical protein PPACK8108_LOCUS6237 [Phakopsora pachyrhizi]|uniref:Uncharacterized protein n=1 Tax=Phakopsora pachyrhizi TaxID=170000 RepID=A0AAV0ARV9_PHAPC|nr:hypothetical protein PPACK8108_LOCUS6237 [Phakopsora pachyrhizi]